MKALLSIILFLSPELVLAQEVSELTQVDGWWCFARSTATSAEKVLKWGCALEESKNRARRTCNEQYGNCEIVQCYEDNPYKYTCIAGLPQGETTYGGFRAYSDSEDAAKEVAFRNCSMKWGPNVCQVLCHPNFAAPTAALEEKKRIQSETALPTY